MIYKDFELHLTLDMPASYNIARPSRAGEAFARQQYSSDSSRPAESKTSRFDVRNPSALAPDAVEEDAVLEADVIGGGGAGTKRGAVNLDGYDSDSDNAEFDTRAAHRAKIKGKRSGASASLADALDNYGKNDNLPQSHKLQAGHDDDDDMFADQDETRSQESDEDEEAVTSSKSHRHVRFLKEEEIEGQVASSKSGGYISANFALDPKGKLSTHAIDDNESSEDDVEEAALMAEEEGIDAEVGAGGSKKNAPKVDAFNMRAEQEDGRFDEAGNFVRKARDPDAIHDSWLEGVSKKDVKKAAEAHEQREASRRRKQIEDDAQLLPNILNDLITLLDKGETALEALARLGKRHAKIKKVPKWKLKKKDDVRRHDVAGIASDPASLEDTDETHTKEEIERITVAADQLLSRGQTNIYELEREMLIRQYCRETGEQWAEPQAGKEGIDNRPSAHGKSWEFRWTDGRQGGLTQGPYDSRTMLAWQDAGYFGADVEFRDTDNGHGEGWCRVAEFS